MSTLGERLVPGTSEDAGPDTPPGSPPANSPPRWNRRRVAVIVIAVVAVLVVVGIFFGLRRQSSTAPYNRASIPAGQVSAAHVLRLKGTTEAIHSRAILAPVLSGQQVGILTITKLLPAGTRVKQGELLVEFDRQAQMRDFIDKQAEFHDRLERGIVKAEDLHELGDLLNGKCRGRKDDREITFFKNNTGMGIQFAATARKMLS